MTIPFRINNGGSSVSQHQELAHQLAAGFLQKAAQFAEKYGQDNLDRIIEQALSNIVNDCTFDVALGQDAQAAREALLAASRIVHATLAADVRTVH
jgi:hypothetical protein